MHEVKRAYLLCIWIAVVCKRVRLLLFPDSELVFHASHFEMLPPDAVHMQSKQGKQNCFLQQEVVCRESESRVKELQGLHIKVVFK